MKRQIPFTLIFLLLAMIGSSQTEADIRKHYQEVNKQITESIENGYEGPLPQRSYLHFRVKRLSDMTYLTHMTVMTIPIS